ncbi:SRPBCC domain-containing protein [uncultured Aquimarina sp.]|uniref:SRPBCC family protein n=1 Tax=uncultured Aquimarina sp. TaxID=575652 RepID=UPI00263805DB|nr:SRPBCC domain-containing protein [uncultured Aquimarina sp.]
MNKSIKLTKVYDFPVEKIWKALTDQKALSEWLMPCDFEPKVGHKFQFKTKPYPGFDGITNCEVLELKENEKLSFSWNGGSLKNTIVSFTLTPQNQQTRLDFEHSGFEGLVNNFIVKKILSNGWRNKILTIQLPKYLSND